MASDWERVKLRTSRAVVEEATVRGNRMCRAWGILRNRAKKIGIV